MFALVFSPVSRGKNSTSGMGVALVVFAKSRKPDGSRDARSTSAVKQPSAPALLVIKVFGDAKYDAEKDHGGE